MSFYGHTDQKYFPVAWEKQGHNTQSLLLKLVYLVYFWKYTKAHHSQTSSHVFGSNNIFLTCTKVVQLTLLFV